MQAQARKFRVPKGGMRYATTTELVRLNDAAVLHDFIQWLRAEFFGVVADDVHVLAYAFPHGIGPDSQVGDPPHHRTVWYVRMKDDSYRLTCLDIVCEEVDALPEIPDTPGLFPGALGDPTHTTIPAILVVHDPDDGQRTIVDGRGTFRVLEMRGENPDSPEMLREFEGVSSEELEEIRARIPAKAI